MQTAPLITYANLADRIERYVDGYLYSSLMHPTSYTMYDDDFPAWLSVRADE